MTRVLLFLHGVDHQPNDQEWLKALRATLMDQGFTNAQSMEVVQPNYLELLKQDRIPETGRPPGRSANTFDDLDARARFEIGQASLRRLLSIDAEVAFEAGLLGAIPRATVDRVTDVVATRHPTLQQAGRYVRDENLRNAVLARVLAAIPRACGELVLVGHSLGSLVAIDLLDHLPSSVTLVRLVTLGSPGASQELNKHSDRLLRRFPYSQVGSWLNVYSVLDPVSQGRGLARLFPAAVDHVIDLGPFTHAAAAYMTNPDVALAVGEALLGSLSREVDRQASAVDQALQSDEAQVIFAFYFAHETLHEMRGTDEERARRFSAALAVVQRQVGDLTVSAIAERRSSIPSEILALQDLAQPRCPRLWDLDTSVRLLVVTATTNLVAPWDIDSHKSANAALPHASAALGFGAAMGAKVSESILEARQGLGLEHGPAWGRALVAAAGIALIVAVPAALVLAAPAGLAGAAAITAALAAFGPGGMVGGMVLAGSLVGTGAVTATAALLAAAPPKVLELEVLRRMAHSRSRQVLALPKDPYDWRLLAELESRVSREHDRLVPLSDKKSETVRILETKRAILQKAIAWMLKYELGPRMISNGND